jgi:hypothetical protein
MYVCVCDVVSTYCQIFPINSLPYGEVNKNENLPEKFDSFLFDVLLTVQSIARQTIQNCHQIFILIHFIIKRRFDLAYLTVITNLLCCCS